MPRQIDLSVVVAVSEGASTLARALQSIVDSDLERDRFEVIVVDDASGDNSAVIAGRYADTVIRLSARRSGLAYARNRGAEIARGDLVAFVDQDIAVRPDTLRRMSQVLADTPRVAAISAVHDTSSLARNFTSQYWNLLLHVGESRYSGFGASLGSGCNMVRKSILAACGMYDEWRFGKGTLEGVELGQRMSRAGHAIVSTNSIQVTPLRRWNVLAAAREAFSRSALLARSLGYQQTRAAAPGDVVFTLSRAAMPAIAALSMVGLLGAFLRPGDWMLTSAAGLALVVTINARVIGAIARQRGIVFALGVVPTHLCLQSVSVAGLCVGWLMRDAVGDRLPDAATQAYAEVGVEMWPPVPRPR